MRFTTDSFLTLLLLLYLYLLTGIPKQTHPPVSIRGYFVYSKFHNSCRKYKLITPQYSSMLITLLFADGLEDKTEDKTRFKKTHIYRDGASYYRGVFYTAMPPLMRRKWPATTDSTYTPSQPWERHRLYFLLVTFYLWFASFTSVYYSTHSFIHWPQTGRQTPDDLQS